jgi:hypothetical protein
MVFLMTSGRLADELVKALSDELGTSGIVDERAPPSEVRYLAECLADVVVRVLGEQVSDAHSGLDEVKRRFSAARDDAEALGQGLSAGKDRAASE